MPSPKSVLNILLVFFKKIHIHFPDLTNKNDLSYSCVCLDHDCMGAHRGEKMYSDLQDPNWWLWATQCTCWELSISPLKKQQVLLTVEPTPQSYWYYLIFILILTSSATWGWKDFDDPSSFSPSNIGLHTFLYWNLFSFKSPLL